MSYADWNWRFRLRYWRCAESTYWLGPMAPVGLLFSKNDSDQNSIYIKTVNLVTNILGWSRAMLSVNGRSHVIRHILTIRIFRAPKKLCFWQNREEVFNWLNSASWAAPGPRAGVMGWGHVQGSHVEVTCKGHASCLRWFAFMNGWNYNGADSSSQT